MLHVDSFEGALWMILDWHLSNVRFILDTEVNDTISIQQFFKLTWGVV